MAAEVEALVLEARRAHRYWGARRLALELKRLLGFLVRLFGTG